MAVRTVRRFTLLELTVVIAIMGLTATLAVAALRAESPSKQLQRSALELETFCARVRWQAMEQGEDRTVLFSPDSKTFTMGGITDEYGNQPEGLPRLQWKLPDSFEFQAESDMDSTGRMDDAEELFRFFPDGGASGKRKLILRAGQLAVSMEISLLTGTLNIQEETENNQ